MLIKMPFYTCNDQKIDLQCNLVLDEFKSLFGKAPGCGFNLNMILSAAKFHFNNFRLSPPDFVYYVVKFKNNCSIHELRLD